LEGGGGGIPLTKSDQPSHDSLTHKPSGISGVGSVTGPVGEIMSELDNPINMPDGLKLYQWERFVTARHHKVESERKLKEVAMNLAEMNSFLRRREKEDDRLQDGIQNAYMLLNKIHEDKALYDINTEIQFLLKQGQVEIDTSSISPDFTDSILIHRSNIEELNNQIKALGEVKLASMVECKDFKKGIRILEWEIRRLQMEAEDLMAKAKDIQMLRVTKELQERLMMENIQSKDQQQIETLENTIKLNKKIHRRRLYGYNKLLGNKKNSVEERRLTNERLDGEVKEMSIKVIERKNIKDLAGNL
jgi:hypothetical protein